ncbi:MAG: T9SS type A sorting domain-containing protein [Ignavibacteriales bacterium]|nr:T9SS type A sorting domain-containing protein [Ignavibacteriales bacterium]
MKIFLVIITLFSFAHTINAQWGTTANNNLRVSNQGLGVSAAEDGNSGTFILFGTGSQPHTVGMQWVDRYGIVRWPLNLAIHGKWADKGSFNVIKSGFGSAFIIYKDGREVRRYPNGIVVYHWEIFMNKVDTSGELLLGSEGGKITDDTLQIDGFNVIPSEDGGLYIAWNSIFDDEYSDSSAYYVQKIGADGKRKWGNNGILIYTATRSSYIKPEISRKFPDGIFVWYNSKYQSFLASFDGNATKRWVKTNKYWYQLPIGLPDGGGMWIYTSTMNGSGLKQFNGNRIDSSGQMLWNDTAKVLDYNYYDCGITDIKLLDSSQVAYFWGRVYENSSKTEGYFQILKPDGTLYYRYGSKLVGPASASVRPIKIVLSDEGNFILLWTNNDSISGNGYCCQKFNKLFKPLWNTDKVFYAHILQEFASIISDGNSGVIAVWTQFYPNPLGTYAQQVSKNGNLGEVLTSVENTTDMQSPGNFFIKNYPNPFNSTTKIMFKNNTNSNVLINIYNSLGQLVKRLIDEYRPIGSYQTTWDGRDTGNNWLPSGIYFARIIAGPNSGTAKIIMLK